MIKIDKLRGEYEKAEQRLRKLGGEYDDAKRRLREKYANQLQQASDAAARAQKELCDAEAAAALADREDGRRIAENLGLTLPDA